MTTQEDVNRWVAEAKKKNCTHLMVVCDTFEYEEYPVYIYPKGKKTYDYEHDDIEAARKHYREAPMSRIMEVIEIK